MTLQDDGDIKLKAQLHVLNNMAVFKLQNLTFSNLIFRATSPTWSGASDVPSSWSCMTNCWRLLRAPSTNLTNLALTFAKSLVLLVLLCHRLYIFVCLFYQYWIWFYVKKQITLNPILMHFTCHDSWSRLHWRGNAIQITLFLSLPSSPYPANQGNNLEKTSCDGSK